MGKIAESENLEFLYPEFNTKPRVYYKNLYRYLKCFIGGSVAFQKEGITDCAEGARVALLKDSNKIDETMTDNFGDFKFDDLEENSGKYTLEVVFKDYDKKTLEVDLNEIINVGTINF